jgi:hypothetical protein
VFIGHFAVAFAAKRAAPELSLGTLFLAAQLADLVWPTLVMLGVESFEIRPGITAVTPLDFVHYPYSHSLVAMAGWGLLLSIAWLAVRRGTPKAALLLLAVVLSHWLLDVISHRPDMPLTLGGDARLGMGLWDSLAGTLVVEGALFAAGVALYARTTRALDRVGRWAFWGLVAFLCVVYAASVLGPPPSPAAVPWAGQAIWLLVAWGYWVDRHRAARIKSAIRGQSPNPY